MIPENLTYEQFIKDMKACEQSKGMNVLQHGEMVRDYFHDLYFHLYENTKLAYEWRLPKWLIENKNFILNEMCNENVMQKYMVLHDCGKPYCITVDENRKQHFPNHAEVSYQVYNKLFPKETVIADLIRMDMDVHCLKGEDVEKFAQNHLATSLLVSALCEIHANASMFGGIESTSFKIKWKQIDKRGRQVFEKIPNT